MSAVSILEKLNQLTTLQDNLLSIHLDEVGEENLKEIKLLRQNLDIGIIKLIKAIEFFIEEGEKNFDDLTKFTDLIRRYEFLSYKQHHSLLINILDSFISESAELPQDQQRNVLQQRIIEILVRRFG